MLKSCIFPSVVNLHFPKATTINSTKYPRKLWGSGQKNSVFIEIVGLWKVNALMYC